jgi:integrase
MHDLRQSFCTNLSRAIPMHVVQELAGHSDIRTTRRYYVQVEPELMKRACRAVEAALAEATETEDGSE